MTLEEHIAECYGARYGFKAAGARERFADAMAKEPALKAAAQARLAELEAISAARTQGADHGCVLTKHAVEDVREALKLAG